jgi:transposase
LHPESIGPVPEETARVAQAAFPLGNVYLRVHDEFGGIYQDEAFTALFPARGQPAEAPWRLAFVTLFQFAEGLSDRQAADAVRGRIDWKYMLGLELSDPGFDHTVLSEFRTRLVNGHAELVPRRGGFRMKHALRTLVATVAALSSVSEALAAPAIQSAVCPVAADDVVSGAMGAPAHLFDPTNGVTLKGADTECLFEAGGEMVLVRRSADFFPDSPGATATPEQVDQLRQLIVDEVDYAPVAGVGDAALWATVRDRSLAPQRMAILISKRGVDALVIGVMDTPDALTTATALTQAVIATPSP